MSLGVSFQPGQSGASGYGRRGGESGAAGGGSATPLQTAIKMLSLRLPSRVSPSALAPQALLQGQGAAGIGGDPVSQLINNLLQSSGAKPPPSPMGGQAPMGGQMAGPSGASSFLSQGTGGAGPLSRTTSPFVSNGAPPTPLVRPGGEPSEQPKGELPIGQIPYDPNYRPPPTPGPPPELIDPVGPPATVNGPTENGPMGSPGMFGRGANGSVDDLNSVLAGLFGRKAYWM